MRISFVKYLYENSSFKKGSFGENDPKEGITAVRPQGGLTLAWDGPT